MTKKELIEGLKYARDDDEIIISVEDQVRYSPGSVPLLLPIDYVGGNFISIIISQEEKLLNDFSSRILSVRKTMWNKKRLG
jgi:ACT domain-containing protein